MLTTVLRYDRPVLARLVWAVMGIPHRRDGATDQRGRDFDRLIGDIERQERSGDLSFDD
jgi:hypothetical protein